MKRISVFLIIIMAFVFVGCSNTNNSISSELWIEDIDYLTTKLIEMHPNLFFNTTREEYSSKVDSLKKDIPNLKDGDISFRIHEIMSLIGDAHTKYSMELTQDQVSSELLYPIDIDWFEDECRIISASKEYATIVGLKLIDINGIPIDDILSKFGTIISFENKEWLKFNSIKTIRFSRALKYLGISDSDKITLNLEDDNNITVKKEILPIKFKEFENIEKIYSKDVNNDINKCISDKNPGEVYWFEFIEEDKTLYIKFNTFIDQAMDPSLPKFEDFSSELLECLSINKNNIMKIAVDVRNNPGGYSGYITDLSKQMKSSIEGTDIKTYAISNRGSFSSSLFALADLKKELNATIVGSETGGNAISYGNIAYIEAPNGTGSITYSSSSYDFKEYACLNSNGGGVIPDVKIKESFDNYKRGLDDCYEYIREQ